ncbi:MAG: GNAT family N-acetyltransferase [Rickettsiales bacterium]|nr:GNAT family N-acetyltransferase [Rickettsiales bacterium]
MKNDEFVVLETENLVLRKVVKTDFRSFCKIHQSSSIMKYFDGGSRSLEQARIRFNEIMDHQNRYGFSYYSVFLRDTGEYIGQTGLYYNYDMSVNLCYAFLEEFHGKGYATEAVIGVLKQGFEELNFSVITTMSAPENFPSRHLLEKIGAKFFRERILFSGMKAISYSITKDDFYNDISQIKKYSYRQAVGCMLIDKTGQIYVFQRVDFTDAWQCPEGGLNKDENELDAAYREVYEEIGIEKNKLKLIKESNAFFRYNFEKGYTVDGHTGQKKKFFLFEFLGDFNDFNYTKTSEKQEFLNFKLVSKEEILNLVPSFKKEMYKKVIEEFNSYLR